MQTDQARIKSGLTYYIGSDTLFIYTIGDYPVRRLVELFDRASADPFLPKQFSAIIDQRYSSVNRDTEEAEAIAGKLRQLEDRLTCVASIVAKPLHFGTARQIAAFADPVPFEPFYDPEDASAWVRRMGDRALRIAGQPGI